VPHHAIFIRVEDDDGSQRQFDALYGATFDDLYRLAQPDKPFATIELPGHKGEYVVTIFPHSR
jgi:hypothetical protein